MLLTPVTSSNLRAVGYDAGARELWVEFVNGSVYVYEGVPAEVHAALMAAPSHGKYFDAEVKKAGYGFRRVR